MEIGFNSMNGIRGKIQKQINEWLGPEKNY